MKLNESSIFLLRLTISYIWLKAGISKLLDPNFINNFPKTLTSFAQGSPFDFYSSIITTNFLPNSSIFAQFTIWGEILTGIAFLIGFPMLFSVLTGIFMNINYFFVATSCPSQFLSILMVVAQFVAYTHNAGNFWGLEKRLRK